MPNVTDISLSLQNLTPIEVSLLYSGGEVAIQLTEPTAPLIQVDFSNIGAKGEPGTTTWTGITDKPLTFDPSPHTHDDRYYTESEVDTLLSGFVNSSDLTSEANTRASDDSTLQTNINTEASTRASADTTLQSNIDSEASVRAAADTNLQSQITNETESRTSADTALQSDINNHISDTSNPHGVTKAQVGLSDADNTSDLNKPISTAQQTALDAKADLIGGLIPTSQIPAIAITEFLGNVASQSAMLSLSGEKGDWAIRTDQNKVYVITGADPSVLGNWTALSYPADAITSVNGKTGVVTLSYTDVGAAAAVHTHPATDVTEDSTHRFVTDSEKATWNAKQSALGYTAENAANKDTDSTFATNSDTKYPSQKAVKTALDSKQNILTDAHLKALGVARQILVSNVQLSNSGSTTENTVFTGTIPGNTIGINGSFIFEFLASFTNNANNKAIRIKLNGTNVFQVGYPSTASTRSRFIISNRNSLSSQVFGGLGGGASWGYSTTTGTINATSSFNTAADVTVTVTITNASASDTTSIESLQILALS
jgi:hypothetical protein